MTRFGAYLKVPVVVSDNDPVADVKSQPGPLPRSLGGEERLEKVRDILRGNARPAIFDTHQDLVELALGTDHDAPVPGSIGFRLLLARVERIRGIHQQIVQTWFSSLP